MIAERHELPTDVAKMLERVPAFPSVALKLPQLMNHEDTGFSQVAGCIASDPVLSGQLIKRANAADQANYCEVRTVLQAVSALGMDQTRQVVLTLAAATYARSANQSPALRQCWNHSLAAALIASDLARLCAMRPTEAFTAALLHDIGRLGLLNASTEEYDTLTASGATSEELLSAEERIFGINHVEAGGWLAGKWNLPASIAEAILRHHQPEGAALDQVGLVRMACRLAAFLGFASHATPSAPELDEIVAPLPPWVRTQLAAQMPVLQAAIVQELRHFGTAGDSPEIASQQPAAEDEPPAGPVLDILPEPPAGRFPRGLIILGALAGGLALALAVLLLRYRF